jgi:hypothetical protein
MRVNNKLRKDRQSVRKLKQSNFYVHGFNNVPMHRQELQMNDRMRSNSYNQIIKDFN